MKIGTHGNKLIQVCDGIKNIKKQIPLKLCGKKVSFYVSKCVTSDYLNPHWKASDTLGEHCISIITNKSFTAADTVMNFILY